MTRIALSTMSKVFIFAGLVLLTVQSVTSKTLTATVSMSGINGSVKFIQPTISDSTTIKFNLDGITEDLTVRMHSLPMMYKGNVQTSCNSTVIGAVYDPSKSASVACSISNKQSCAIGDISGKFGYLSQSQSKNTFTDSNLPLSGKTGIYHSRTLVFMTTSGVVKACALVASETPVLTAIARFKGPIAGTVYFRQAKELEASLMYVNLFYVNATVAKKEFYLEIHDNKASEFFNSAQCSNIGGVYNPYSTSNKGVCNETNQDACHVGDLKAKLGYIYVSEATPSLSNTQVVFTDTNLPVLGKKTIIGHSLVLYSHSNPATPIACTNIQQILKRTAEAKFTAETTEGVTGTFKFSQRSPFEPTEVEIDISNLEKKAEGYHVHEYPNPGYKHIMENSKACSADVAGGHWNPYGIDPAKSPPNGQGTFDEYEIGDLSAKYGSFLNQDKYTGSYSDLNLPLFGKNSIIGRSIVIHYLKKDGNKRWVCRNIQVVMPDTSLIVAQSHFKRPQIQGNIIMEQYMTTTANAAPFDTAFYLDLTSSDGEKSNNHNWHVHEKKVGDDMAKSGAERCQSPGPHFNPYEVYVKGNYISTCKPDNPLRCELGDSSAKTSQYSLGSGPKFYTDIDTPLAGANSVIGRSIVIHSRDGGAPRQGCADIVVYKPSPSSSAGLSSMVSLIAAVAVLVFLLSN